MSNISIGLPMQNRHISSSLMEKMLSITNNSLIPLFFEIYKTEATGKGIKNVTVNRSGEMTFLPKGKESVVDTTTFPNVWKKDSRQSGSYGKVLRKLLVENGIKEVNASELEEIVNVLKGFYTVEGEFIIVSGDDISYYYLDDNYDYGFNIGSMESSCMRYGGACQDATKLYADNKNCQMVVLKHPDKPAGRGRAILWTDENGDKWLDRVYASDHIVRAFHQFARSRGYGHKVHQDACDGDWISPSGEQDSHVIKIMMDTDHEILPYMDSMYYVYSNFVSNSSDWGSYDRYAQTEPDEQADNVWDGYDDCYINSEDSVYLDYRDMYTYSSNAFYCDLTDDYFLHDDGVELNDGRTVWNEADDIIYIQSTGNYYHIDDVGYCQYNDEHYPSDQVEWVDDLEMDIYEPSINNAYEDKGWVQDENGEWVDPQHELEF